MDPCPRLVSFDTPHCHHSLDCNWTEYGYTSDVARFRIDSIESKLLETPDAARWAFGLLSRSQTMGFCPRAVASGGRLDSALLAELAGCLEEAGVAEEAATRLRAGIKAGSRRQPLARELRALVQALDASPMPGGEWGPAREVLGDDLLARLVGDISPSSLKRYAAGSRETPDQVAWRLHAVARILASLLGSYNDYGVRRWFERRRSALAGKAPVEVLEAAADEDDPLLLTTLSLADELVGAGVGT